MRAIESWRGRWRLTLDDGEGITADVVLLTTGETPETGWMAACGHFSEQPARVGQWIAAMEQGRAAAATLLSGDRPVPPATLLPRAPPAAPPPTSTQRDRCARRWPTRRAPPAMRPFMLQR